MSDTTQTGIPLLELDSVTTIFGSGAQATVANVRWRWRKRHPGC